MRIIIWMSAVIVIVRAPPRQNYTLTGEARVSVHWYAILLGHVFVVFRVSGLCISVVIRQYVKLDLG